MPTGPLDAPGLPIRAPKPAGSARARRYDSGRWLRSRAVEVHRMRRRRAGDRPPRSRWSRCARARRHGTVRPARSPRARSKRCGRRRSTDGQASSRHRCPTRRQRPKAQPRSVQSRRCSMPLMVRPTRVRSGRRASSGRPPAPAACSRPHLGVIHSGIVWSAPVESIDSGKLPQESRKAKRKPGKMPGARIGSVTSRNTCQRGRRDRTPPPRPPDRRRRPGWR